MTRFDFDPDRVAICEATGWRAYYDHAWLRLFRLIVGLCEAQFHIPFPISLRAGYLITRASAAWVAVEHDEQKILALHEQFYRIAQRHSGLGFDPRRAAQLEERYWDVHRHLSGKPDKTEFIETMIQLHSELFGISREQARESAELRVLANNTVDLITSRQSVNPEADWQKIEDTLKQCYHSIRAQLNSAERV